MGRARTERRLAEVGARLAALRKDLQVAEQAFSQVEFEADDARLRAMVSETPLAQKEHEQARRQSELALRSRDSLRDEIAQLEQRQDELLDTFNSQT